jgi:hypothetical protein
MPLYVLVWESFKMKILETAGKTDTPKTFNKKVTKPYLLMLEYHLDTPTFTINRIY